MLGSVGIHGRIWQDVLLAPGRKSKRLGAKLVVPIVELVHTESGVRKEERQSAHAVALQRARVIVNDELGGHCKARGDEREEGTRADTRMRKLVS